MLWESVRVHIYDSRLEVYLGSSHTETLQRVFVSDINHRSRQVDYRHVISSLERKPQAFRYSQLRDDLLPNDTYKAVWELVDKQQDARKACKTMVGILGLAHRANCEDALGSHLQRLLDQDTVPSLYQLLQKFDTHKPSVPPIDVNQPPASTYDALLVDHSMEVD